MVHHKVTSIFILELMFQIYIGRVLPWVEAGTCKDSRLERFDGQYDQNEV